MQTGCNKVVVKLCRDVRTSEVNCPDKSHEICILMLIMFVSDIHNAGIYAETLSKSVHPHYFDIYNPCELCLH
jgi:hypothetical protein